MTVHYFKVDVRNVTEMYYDVILSAIKKNGIEIKEHARCSYIQGLDIPKSDYILVTSVQYFLKLYVWGHRNFIYWFQGITPEECLMSTGSKFNYHLFSFIEKLALKTTKYKIGVSKYLFEHYEKKYRFKFKPDELFVMPCFNSVINKESFYYPQKYEKNIFCYAGGMQAWQGFEDIVKIFKKMEKEDKQSFLKVLSKDKEGAKAVLEKYGITRYSLNCVPQEEMDNELAECKFGFIIREDNIINNVATPTKLGTYIGNGVIPIFTPAVKAFVDLCKQYNYLCCVDYHNPMEALRPYLECRISPNEISQAYQKLYSEYYDKEMYIDKMSKFLTLI